MKNYLLFLYSIYYPSGGMLDFVMDFDTIEQANEFVKNYDNPIDHWDRGHLFSISERKNVNVYTNH